MNKLSKFVFYLFMLLQVLLIMSFLLEDKNTNTLPTIWSVILLVVALSIDKNQEYAPWGLKQLYEIIFNVSYYTGIIAFIYSILIILTIQKNIELFLFCFVIAFFLFVIGKIKLKK